MGLAMLFTAEKVDLSNHFRYPLSWPRFEGANLPPGQNGTKKRLG